MNTSVRWLRRVCLAGTATLCATAQAESVDRRFRGGREAHCGRALALRERRAGWHGADRRSSHVARSTRLRVRENRRHGAAGRGRIRSSRSSRTTTARTTATRAYPVVADPRSSELNRLQLTNTSLPLTTVTVGRQRIVLDDHRFVGNVGWRQNEQAFDALRIVNKSVPHLTLDMTWLDQVNRVFGRDSAQGRYYGDTVLANASYEMARGKLTGFAYRIDIELLPGVPNAVRDASQTFGLRYAGAHTFDVVKLSYVASYATQQEAARNPLSFDLDYYFGEINAGYGPCSFGAGVELLEGDGSKGFTTPLATLHRFQGWADKFLATPADGIDDRYLTAGVSRQQWAALEPFPSSPATTVTPPGAARCGTDRKRTCRRRLNGGA